MAIEYCHYCHKYIDLDYNVEHFMVEDERYSCCKAEEDGDLEGENEKEKS